MTKTIKKAGFILMLGLGIAILAGGRQGCLQANANDAKEPIPFGINNPFAHSDTDPNGEQCFENNSQIRKTATQNKRGQALNVEFRCYAKIGQSDFQKNNQ